MAFEVLVRVPSGRLVWKDVDGCISHSEAKLQGAAQYAGEIKGSRVKHGINTSNSETYMDVGGSWGLIILGGGLILVVTLWPLIVAGGVIYISTVLYKWWKNRGSH
tara:strand:- start:217 stop:534 length:318 start_codon:yes stop_codon:yes gene_type:complete